MCSLTHKQSLFIDLYLDALVAISSKEKKRGFLKVTAMPNERGKHLLNDGFFLLSSSGRFSCFFNIMCNYAYLLSVT